MKISELATAANVSAKTIRYYEQVGLLPAAGRADNGYRYYRSEDVATLVFIRRCRELNMPLNDIKQLLELQQNPGASCALVDNIIDTQLQRIRQTQRELASLETSLSSLAACCNSQLVQNCSILHQLKSD